MKIISWNVNGIRAVMKKNFMEFFNKEDADIYCLQEIKVHNDDVPEEIKQIGALNGYSTYWNGAKRKGYSGTGIITKIKPISYETNIGDSRFDDEGRFQILEFEQFFLINTYVPNVKHDLSRLKERQEFDKLLLKKTKELEKKKPVIICGDMNVAHKAIDLARPKPNEGNAGYTLEEREGMTNYINSDLIDTFRHFNKDTAKYSWWSYRANARINNVGWRIDYFLVSKSIIKKVIQAEIYDKVLGSDHCPILIEIIS